MSILFFCLRIKLAIIDNFSCIWLSVMVNPPAMKNENDNSISVRFAGRLGGLRRNPKKGFGSMDKSRLSALGRSAALARWSRPLPKSPSSFPLLDLLGGAGGELHPQ